MEIRNFPENHGFNGQPEVVHYDGAEQIKAEMKPFAPIERTVAATPQAPVFEQRGAMPAEGSAKSQAEASQEISGEVAAIMKVAKERGAEEAAMEVRDEEPAVIDAAHDALVENIGKNFE